MSDKNSSSSFLKKTSKQEQTLLTTFDKSNKGVLVVDLLWIEHNVHNVDMVTSANQHIKRF